MSIARPDTSRRREPTCPGRRFGACVSRAAVAPFLAALIATLTTFVLVSAAPGRAEDREPPIRLSNADVERLHAEQAAVTAKVGATTSPEPGAVQPVASPPPARALADDASEPDEADAELDEEFELDAAAMAERRAIEARLRAKLDQLSRRSMENVSRKLDARVLGDDDDDLRDLDTSRDLEEALPLPAAPAQPAGEPEARLRGGEPEPACVYGSRGQLIYAPEGRACAPVRVGGAPKLIDAPAARRQAAEREASVGCVYGSRGQLLYASPGVECAG